jgi:hypothetical protein
MTLAWFVYMTMRMTRGMDESDDGLAIIPALVIDMIIVVVYGSLIQQK